MAEDYANQDVTTTIREISALWSNAQKAAEMFLALCQREGLGVFITETLRTKERQDYLYSLGRTRPGKIVTWTRNSRHMEGRAWDIATKGENLYDKEILKKCGQLAKSIGITWGGDWQTPDMPHFEVEEGWCEKMAEDKIKEEETKEDKMAEDKIKDDKMKDDKTEKRFFTLDEVPPWAREEIQCLMARDAFAEPNNLDLSLDMLRVLIILMRYMRKTEGEGAGQNQ